MNTDIFLAKKIGLKADKSGKLTATGRLVSTISVAISMCVVIIAIAVAQGFRAEISGKARGFAADICLTTPGEDISNTVYPINSNLSYLSRIKELPFVDNIYGVSYKQGILKTDNEISGVVVKGVDSLYNFSFFKKNLVDGNIPDFGTKRASDEILLSKRLADIMQYRVGDRVIAYFVGSEIKVRSFKLAGVFDAQVEQVDKYFALADIRHLSVLNGWKEQVGGYEIFLKDSKISLQANDSKLLECVNQINEIIYDYTLESDSSVSISTLNDKFFALKDWLHLLDLNVLIVLSLMIVVAGFNMISGLLILLFERISQIGLLKALGMTNKSISVIFLIQGAFIVLKGMLCGNVVAIAFCLLESKFNFIPLSPDNYFVSSVPVKIGAWEIIVLDAVAFALIMVLLVLPCSFISRVSPANTMRVK